MLLILIEFQIIFRVYILVNLCFSNNWWNYCSNIVAANIVLPSQILLKAQNYCCFDLLLICKLFVIAIDHFFVKKILFSGFSGLLQPKLLFILSKLNFWEQRACHLLRSVLVWQEVKSARLQELIIYMIQDVTYFNTSQRCSYGASKNEI